MKRVLNFSFVLCFFAGIGFSCKKILLLLVIVKSLLMN